MPVCRSLRCRRIRSLKVAQKFYLPGYTIRALPRQRSRPTLDYGPLLQEPAITDLDWSFAPSPRSWEPVALEHPFAPPWPFRATSSCPGEDQPVSGVTLVTPRIFIRRTSPLTRLCASRFRYDFVVLPLNLATMANSPARVSRRTM